jgi:glutaredoxin 3
MIQLYSKDDCIYCNQAKKLLNTLGVRYEELKLGVHFTRETLLEMFPSAKRFPVVVVDGMHIGGYNELQEEMKRQTSDTRILLKE